MAKSRRSVSRFVLEIFSIFLGVTIAFLANHWNEQRKERIIERKTLKEISIELKSDIRDIRGNIMGHKLAIEAVNVFQRYNHGEVVAYDSLNIYFDRLYRDYISITNTTAYETLRSRGIEIISNDQLRADIVELYDFAYEIIQKLEEDYYPAQFHRNYFNDISEYYKKYMEIEGDDIRFIKPHQGKPDPKMLLILREIKQWRLFNIASYEQTEEKIIKLIQDINTELDE
ncbi:MAG: hypothetical protein HEP71_15250 [Roseivirga sp.]|nr:hypothetical protein [Roseivirga sp.]